MTRGPSDNENGEIFTLQLGTNGLYADVDTLYITIFDTIGVPYSKLSNESQSGEVEAYECAL